MKLKDIVSLVEDENLAILAPLDCGATEMHTIEIMRGGRLKGARKEYMEWLYRLDLDVRSISFTNADACGNKNLLCIHCEPIKVSCCRGDDAE